MDNYLRTLREAAGMSTAELAAQAGAPTLSVHRIESNRLLAPVSVAKRVSAVLGKSIDDVFPNASEALNQFEMELHQPGVQLSQTYRRLREVGLEADPRQHRILMLLRGHKRTISFPIEAREADRLFSTVQSEGASHRSEFACFDSDDLRVAINLAQVVYIHFLWEAPFVHMLPTKKDNDEDDPSEVVRIFFNGDDDPIILSADRKTPRILRMSETISITRFWSWKAGL